MKIKTCTLHGIAILAGYWLNEKVSTEFFEEEIKSITELKKFCSQFEDTDELYIMDLPF